MPRISKVYWPKFDLRYGYLFDIRNEDELYDYWRACRKGQMLEGWNDYMQSSEWQNASGQGPGKHHCTTDNGAMLAVLVNAEQGKEENRRDVIHIWTDFNDEMYARMRDTIADRGQIFVNRKGGYFPPLPDHRITDTQDIKAYALPGSKITVTRWPNGTHWYARVGGEDVEYCGRKKWDSHDEALACANLWAKRMGVAIEPE